jgi:uncharacterized protein (TIGR02466 family)
MAMHTELWFPSVIWSSMIHVIDNNALKHFAYDCKRADAGRVISNYGGYQSQDLSYNSNPEITKLAEYISQEANTCAKQVGLNDVELYNIWININPPGSYNHLHNHVGSIFSGVYYVDAVPEQGNIQFERSDNAEHHIPEEVYKATYFTSTRATYAAKTGGLYIFPSWLKHSVEGNRTTTDRISISFNFGEKK